jgi:hypothetical protein
MSPRAHLDLRKASFGQFLSLTIVFAVDLGKLLRRTGFQPVFFLGALQDGASPHRQAGSLSYERSCPTNAPQQWQGVSCIRC